MLSILYTFIAIVLISEATRITGAWDISSKYKFLQKFGFQKTRIDELTASRGYIYGNITLRGSSKNETVNQFATMIVVDGDYILDIHSYATAPWWSFHQMTNSTSLENRKKFNKSALNHEIENQRCQKMFNRVDKVAWDKKCAPKSEMDLIRKIPCHKDKRCGEEDDPERMIDYSQFTYTIQDFHQPRYWYLALVACRRNPSTCKWESSLNNLTLLNHSNYIDYDIWLVNGDPKLKEFNKFEHQFSFEYHETLEIYIFFSFIYFILSSFVQFKLNNCKEPFVILLKLHLWICTFYTLLQTIELITWSIDGYGMKLIANMSMILNRWSHSFLVMLIIGIAEHISVDPFGILRSMNSYLARVRNKKLPFDSNSFRYFSLTLIIILILETGLFIWAIKDQDPVVDVLVWNTTGGCLILALRFLVIFWFLVILRNRLLHFDNERLNSRTHLSRKLFIMERNKRDTLDSSKGDIIHFAAGSLLWFLALPMIVFIAQTSVSALWRTKTIITVNLCFDFVAACICSYILITTRYSIENNDMNNIY